MQLHELYNVEKKSRDISGKLGLKLDDLTDKEKESGVKGGLFSTVKPANDSHMMKKTSRIPVQKPAEFDPYWLYVDFIVDNSLAQSNPYFPRIYKTLDIKDRTSNTTKRAEIEKLIHGDDLSTAELNALYERFYGTRSKEGYDKRDILRYFTSSIHYAIEEGDASSSVDEQFKEYVKLVSDLFWEKTKSGLDLRVDMHLDNIMFRRTQHGIQLVIIDPFASATSIPEIKGMYADRKGGWL